MSSLIQQKAVLGILLAGGLSSRFGANNKCLHRLKNDVPIGLQAAKNLAVAVRDVVCVVPSAPSELNQMFLDNGFTTIVNTSPEDGIAESIRLAVAFAQQNDDYQACVIALADMPMLKPETIGLIVERLLSRGGIVAPVYKGKRGHPVGFNKDYFSELDGLRGDVGARSIIKGAGDALCLIDCNDVGVLQDFDTMHDVTRYQQQAEKLQE